MGYIPWQNSDETLSTWKGVPFNYNFIRRDIFKDDRCWRHFRLHNTKIEVQTRIFMNRFAIAQCTKQNYDWVAKSSRAERLFARKIIFLPTNVHLLSFFTKIIQEKSFDEALNKYMETRVIFSSRRRVRSDTNTHFWECEFCGILTKKFCFNNEI